MIKHTNKVHGKLNFLMIAVVVVIGAVSYLLVQSGTIDPSQGTSSGIKGVQKADKYVSKNDKCVTSQIIWFFLKISIYSFNLNVFFM